MSVWGNVVKTVSGLKFQKKMYTFGRIFFLFRYCLVVKNQPKIVMFGHPEQFW